MKLQELLKNVAVLESTAAGNTEIHEVRYDSRAVQPGDLFVAIRGYATDGHKYIAKALEQGAAAVVCEEAPEGAPAVVVENSRRALAEIAVRYRDAEGQDCEAALTVSGEEPATDDTRFAACVAEFALVLRQSQYRGTASLGNVLTRLADLNGYLAGDAYKEEFGELVSLAAESGLYEGEAEDPA